ncbi:MAG: 5-oxoprolinase subunit PxpB [Verrucomicrobia bacterium]|nr:5-oxoprolinase subunit PxpB [Verrucomicrobiota bacterium]
MTLHPLGDSAVVVHVGREISRETARMVQALAEELRAVRLPGLTDVVPAFASVALFFDEVGRVDVAGLEAEVAPRVARLAQRGGRLDSRQVEIPVVYGGAEGADLEEVARRTGLAPAEVIARHAGAEYFVNAIGFTPGFPYLGGLPAELATPRRATPRPRVPAGAVGIGGSQTGVYPLESPGGWNLIGRTPLRLFDGRRSEPALLRAGDLVRFRPVPSAEWESADGTGAAPNGHTPGGIEVVRPGMYTTVQDLGRRGFRSGGVPVGGAADAWALRVANLLVGNEEGAAGLEFTLVGPELRFREDLWVALAGAEFADVPSGRPWRVRAGETLRFGEARCGCRGYLAVAGGIDVPEILGSRSTLMRAGMGGGHGRALAAGDRVAVARGRTPGPGQWQVDPRVLSVHRDPAVVRVVRGAEASEFPSDAWGTEFTVSRQSDRMGVRLEGPALVRQKGAELISTPVAPGTVQVPPDGHPILLLAEAQTIGGYPQWAHVITVDLPRVAQLRPGESVRFQEVSLAEARELWTARQRSLALLREGLKGKWS